MNFKIVDMNYYCKYQIIRWKYNKPYDVYNFPNIILNQDVVINDKYFAVINENFELVGYYCIDEEARVITNESERFYSRDFLDMGLGLRPDLTGLGLGLEFVNFGVKFLKHEYNKRIRLTVACFNKRAIKVYKRAGFSQGEIFIRPSTNCQYEFMIMRLI